MSGPKGSSPARIAIPFTETTTGCYFVENMTIEKWNSLSEEDQTDIALDGEYFANNTHVELDCDMPEKM